MSRKVEIELEYQNYLEAPPVPSQALYGQACANDEVTVNAWRDVWLKNIKENHAKYGPFKNKGIGKFFGIAKNKPVIVAGSGPSLKYNGPMLKNRKDILLVSCLHNFHFLEDQGANPDFYVSLDAGEVTVEEVYEGGTKTPEEYWELTRHRKLLAFIGTSPRLLEKWKGEVYFFNAPIPDAAFIQSVSAVEPFHTCVSTGGNVLGAALYIAKGIFGANPIAFVGADFSFSYDKKFHGWESKYDKNLGMVLKAVDVFGNKVLTWQSYYNFKAWFDWVSLKVPGIYINCTEGGCMGSYAEGNLMSIKQMSLESLFRMYELHEELRAQCENPELNDRKILF